MINLNISLLDEPLAIKGPVYFVVEDQAYFAKLVNDFYYYPKNDEIRLFDKMFSSLKESEILLITDVLGFDVNSSAMLKLIYADLEMQLNLEIETKSKIEQLSNRIADIISLELLNHELDLIMDEITVQEIFKALGIKIETRQSTIFDKLVDIVQVYKYLNKKRLLVFVNVSSYLSNEELVQLFEYVSLNQVDVLFIERYKMTGVTNHILDDEFYFYSETVV